MPHRPVSNALPAPGLASDHAPARRAAERVLRTFGIRGLCKTALRRAYDKARTAYVRKTGLPPTEPLPSPAPDAFLAIYTTKAAQEARRVAARHFGVPSEWTDAFGSVRAQAWAMQAESYVQPTAEDVYCARRAMGLTRPSLEGVAWALYFRPDSSAPPVVFDPIDPGPAPDELARLDVVAALNEAVALGNDGLRWAVMEVLRAFADVLSAQLAQLLHEPSPRFDCALSPEPVEWDVIEADLRRDGVHGLPATWAKVQRLFPGKHGPIGERGLNKIRTRTRPQVAARLNPRARSDRRTGTVRLRPFRR